MTTDTRKDTDMAGKRVKKPRVRRPAKTTKVQVQKKKLAPAKESAGPASEAAEPPKAPAEEVKKPVGTSEKEPPKAPPMQKIDGVPRLCLTTEHRLQFEFFYEKIQRLQAEEGNLNLQAEIKETNSALEVRGLRLQAQQRADMRNKAKDEAAVFSSGLGGIYGVDFKKVTYDSDTGIITEMPEEPKKEAHDGKTMPPPEPGALGVSGEKPKDETAK